MAVDPINVANSARDIYDSGLPQPGKTVSADPGDLRVAGVVKSDSEIIYFGRLVPIFTLDSTKLTRQFSQLVNTDTKGGGVTCFSDDAILGAKYGYYSPTDPITVKERGFIVMEADQTLATTDTLTVNNGNGTTDPDLIGKLSKNTGAGYSTVTGLRITKVFSASLVEVEIYAPITLTPLS